MDFKALRDEAGLTTEQVSEQSGYGVSTINGLEKHGEGSARLKEKLLVIYGCRKLDANLPTPESDLEFWKLRAKTSEKELEDLKAKIRGLLKP